MKPISGLNGGPVSIGGFKLLFLVLLSGMFLGGLMFVWPQAYHGKIGALILKG
jgi:hypothetical protein